LPAKIATFRLGLFDEQVARVELRSGQAAVERLEHRKRHPGEIKIEQEHLAASSHDRVLVAS
jgi:hypothetical protein